MTEYNGGSLKADHLCVLVHGLWGTPEHLTALARSLRQGFSEDQLYILVAKRNSGYFTYDGIETGGERVCLEIEEELAAIRDRGGRIAKLSIVGYSMGGLVARYAIGLMHARGMLDGLECMNFTAFASPFLGIRSPKHGSLYKLWNTLGARTLSMSGRQMFMIDEFRDSRRPMLAVLADPDSIFMLGLARFRRRTLYANVTNDRSAVYYTTSISKTDPYTDMSRVRVRYVAGYEDVVLDPVDPVSPLPPAGSGGGSGGGGGDSDSMAAAAHRFVRGLPTKLALMVLIPIGLTAFVVNAGVQTVRSNRRIDRHLKGLDGVDSARYRVELWMRRVQGAVEDAYENISSAQGADFLGSGSGSDDEAKDDGAQDKGHHAKDGDRSTQDATRSPEARRILRRERRESLVGQPTLALTPDQFAMIRALDDLGWRKYPVWIHKIGHSHAAIIERRQVSGYEEGQVVARHWVKEEFLV